jgi:serine/threonine-protein kinase HipA
MRALDVLIGPVRVGILEHIGEWEYRFSFDADWLRTSEAPLLGQLFEDRKPHPVEATGHVPIWFSHLLPQGRLRRAVAAAAGVDAEDEFALLEWLGSDLPGAVILRPGQPLMSRLPVERSLTAQVASTSPLRFSLAGAQWKLSVREGERGLTIPVRGEPGLWIAKFEDPTFSGLPRIEAATMRWAKLAGVDVPPFREASVSDFDELPKEIPVGSGAVFLVQRFDRGPGETRVHIEDFAQVLDRPPGDAQYGGRYEHLGAFLAKEAPEDVRAFCERLVFCVVAGNTDAHLKNWSLIYHDGRHARLAPAYDLVASALFAPALITDDLALSLGGSRRFEGAGIDAFKMMAEVTETSFDTMRSWVRDAAVRALTVWHTEGMHLPFSHAERERLNAHMQRIPLRY